MSRENEFRMQTLKDINQKYSSSGENLNPELYQLQIQLAAIEEQQRLQTLMIKQFQQQFKVYQDKYNHNGLTNDFLSQFQVQREKTSKFDNKQQIETDDDDDEQKELIIPTEDQRRSISSPLDLSTSDHLSSTSIKSDEEQQIPSSIQFQMEEHEGEPEDPNMAKVSSNISC